MPPVAIGPRFGARVQVKKQQRQQQQQQKKKGRKRAGQVSLSSHSVVACHPRLEGARVPVSCARVLCMIVCYNRPPLCWFFRVHARRLIRFHVPFIFFTIAVVI